MISVLIFIGKFILTIVLCTLFFIPITIAMETSSGHYCYKPKSHHFKKHLELKRMMNK